MIKRADRDKQIHMSGIKIIADGSVGRQNGMDGQTV